MIATLDILVVVVVFLWLFWGMPRWLDWMDAHNTGTKPK